MKAATTPAHDFTDAERGLLKGIALIAVLKVVVVGWIGLDEDAWYVWPWSWLAFAWMLPWVMELVRENKGEFAPAEQDRKRKREREVKGTFGKELGLLALGILGAVLCVIEGIWNADKYQKY